MSKIVLNENRQIVSPVWKNAVFSSHRVQQTGELSQISSRNRIVFIERLEISPVRFAVVLNSNSLFGRIVWTKIKIGINDNFRRPVRIVGVQYVVSGIVRTRSFQSRLSVVANDEFCGRLIIDVKRIRSLIANDVFRFKIDVCNFAVLQRSAKSVSDVKRNLFRLAVAANRNFGIRCTVG